MAVRAWGGGQGARGPPFWATSRSCSAFRGGGGVRGQPACRSVRRAGAPAATASEDTAAATSCPATGRMSPRPAHLSAARRSRPALQRSVPGGGPATFVAHRPMPCPFCSGCLGPACGPPFRGHGSGGERPLPDLGDVLGSVRRPTSGPLAPAPPADAPGDSGSCKRKACFRGAFAPPTAWMARGDAVVRVHVSDVTVARGGEVGGPRGAARSSPRGASSASCARLWSGV